MLLVAEPRVVQDEKKKNVRESLELGFIFKLMDSASVVYLGSVV